MDTIFSILQFLGILILVLVVFNFIIVVHEWGHFLAARWRGLQIDKFQIWFGKPIWKRKWNGVQYGLGFIPAGGFVALPQMAPMEAIEGSSDGTEQREELPPIKPLDKIIVAFAGPLFSFLLAIVFGILVYWIGYPVDEGNKSTTIGYIDAELPASKSDLAIGDEILEIDGNRVDRWMGMTDSVVWGIVSSSAEKIHFKVEKADGSTKDVYVDAPMEDLDKEWDKLTWYQKLFKRPPLRRVGIIPESTPMIGKLEKNSPADLAGLKPNDFIMEVDGMPMTHFIQFVDTMKVAGDKPVDLLILRGDEKLTIRVAARKPDEPKDFDRPLIGITNWNKAGVRKSAHPSPFEQVWESMRSMYNTITAVLSPKSSIGASQLSGPIGIGNLYYNLFEQEDGWKLVLWFSVLLNVNLAILNMLPFPVLDGGHITLSLFEILRRKPMNTRVLEVLQMGCVLLLFSFMIFVTMKDFGGMVGGKGEAETVIFYPPKAGAK